MNRTIDGARPRARRFERLGLPALLLAGLLAGLLSGGCHDGATLLRAKQVESQAELIGGPTARGKIGDFLLENDRIRTIVAGYGATWAAGIFGGTLIDLDLRRTRSEYAYGHGKDAFAESFPTLNLIIVDPESDLRRLMPRADGAGFELTMEESRIEVVKDGSDGEEAIVRVQGAGGYLFDVLKYLNKGFLGSFVKEPLDLAALVPAEYSGILDQLGIRDAYIPALVKALPELLKMLAPLLGIPNETVQALQDVRIDLYRLLERLQIDFDFQTDYILRPGQDYVTIRTTVRLAPPTPEQLAGHCPQLACDLVCGPDGYVMEEVLVDCPPPAQGEPNRCKFDGLPLPGIQATQDAAFCPICECAAPREMPALTESRSVFNDILGSSLDNWTDPQWRSGLAAGDFVFFGSACNLFTPGLGFDENRKIFENMWQGVGTVGNPLVFDWVAGVSADRDVSYAVVTRNPSQKIEGDWAECPSYRYALVWAAREHEAALVEALVGLGQSAGQAAGAVRGLLIDRSPVFVESFDTGSVAERASLEAFAAAALAAPRGEELQALFGERAELGVLPQVDCRAARLLVPLFTTSATIVMTHEAESELEQRDDGVVRDAARVYTYERYLVVGEGDVGSLLDTIYELRGEPYGFVAGAVLGASSLKPIRHAHVFAVRDPRPVIARLSEVRKARLPSLPARVADWDYDTLLRLNREVFGDTGLMSVMVTDRGDDPHIDGDFSGALAPGEWFLVAKAEDRAVSRLVPITVTAGQTTKASLVLAPPAVLDYRVVDAAGALVPARLSLITLDPVTRAPLEWDGLNRVELGDGRSDWGIRELVLAPHGAGSVEVEPGLYRILASRGFEYDVADVAEVELRAGQVRALELQLTRSVDTTGWISGDFHLHQAPSVDSGLSMVDRVAALVAEGVEFATATDHDTITDYRPVLNALDLYRTIAVQIGVETSPLEFGHYNVYPLAYDDRKGEVKDPPPWQQRRIGEVFREMRARGADGPEGTVVQVNHPRDGFMGYFSQAGLNGLTLGRDTPGLEGCNPATVETSCDFDAVELMNEKRFELLRTPTVGEVARYNACLNAIVATDDRARFSVAAPDGSSSPVDPEQSVCGELQALPEGCEDLLAAAAPPAGLTGDDLNAWRIERDHCRWHAQFRSELARCNDTDDLLTCKRIALEALKLLSVRYMIERTPAEQEALQFFREHPEWDPGCSFATATAGCAARPTEDDASFLVGCAEDPTDCACAACVCGTEEAPGLLPGCCQAPGAEDGVGTGWTAECAAACRDQCHACEDAPCTDKPQVIDDWMGFLNQGLRVTGVGNSDSHDVEYEAGLPRNFLRVGADDPAFVDRDAVNRAVLDGRVVVSTGPFVDVRVNDAPVGETVIVGAGQKVAVDVTVQTPRWFGVDRIELYRNGRLEAVRALETPPESIVDARETFVLDRPTEDSWYVVITYGLNEGRTLDPVYHGIPYGKILLPTVLSLALGQLLSPFEDLLEPLSGFIDIAALLGGAELPDSFPALPFAITNPVFVDLAGDGWEAPEAPDWDGDGRPDLPAFCSQACAFERDADDMVVEGPGTCPEGQLCVDDGTGGGQTGRCIVPISAECVDGGWANDLAIRTRPTAGGDTATVRSALTADAASGGAPGGDRDAGLRGRARVGQKLQNLIEERLRQAPGTRRRVALPPARDGQP